MRRSTWQPSRAVLLSLFLISGCTDSPGAPSNLSVRAESLPGSIRVANLRAEPIYSVVLGRERAALASWAACVEPSSCGEIPPGQQVLVPDPNTDRLAATPREREAIVYWWVAVRNEAGNRVAGPIRHVIVELR